jgi:hypothetical protein
MQKGVKNMAKFISKQDSSIEFENLVRNTRSNLYLISPYLDVSESLIQILKIANNPNLKITLIYKTGMLSQSTKKQLYEVNNLSLRHILNLHAKCCFNEGSMIIGSLNIFEKSALYSREMSILLNAAEDGQIFSKALDEVKFIIDSSVIDDEQPVRKQTGTGGQTQTSGFCIRCRHVIPYNLSKPFCESCYKGWEEFENPDYEETFCHSCGSQAVTALSRPQCFKCRNPQST